MGYDVTLTPSVRLAEQGTHDSAGWGVGEDLHPAALTKEAFGPKRNSAKQKGTEMSMSRKDYVAIAEAIRGEVETWESDFPESLGLEAIQGVIEAIADVFAKDNPNFNKLRFVAAALGES